MSGVSLARPAPSPPHAGLQGPPAATRISTPWTCCTCSARAARAGSTRRLVKRDSPPARTPAIRASATRSCSCDRHRTAGRLAPTLETALLAEVERVKAAHHRRGAARRPRIASRPTSSSRRNSVTAQARELGYWAMVDDWRYLTTYLDRIRALTPEAVQTVANRISSRTSVRSASSFRPRREPARRAAAEASARVEQPARRGPARFRFQRRRSRRRSKRRVTRPSWRTASPSWSRRTTASPTLRAPGQPARGHVFDPQGSRAWRR